MIVVEPIPSLKRVFLDGVIRDIDEPKTFLMKLLFPSETVMELDTEFVQIDKITKGLQVAPFVIPGGESVTLKRGTQSAQVIMTPNIAVDQNLSASDKLMERWAGETGESFFSDTRADQRQLERINKLVAEDLKDLDDAITNREEWMVAKALQGSITYTVSGADGGDDFTVTMNKPGANTITLTDKWDNATPATAVKAVLGAIDAAKKLVADNNGPNITDCILGTDADAALMALIHGGHFEKLIDKNLRIDTGTNLTINEEWNQLDGTIYRGTIENVRFWYYNHQIDGEDMIRPKFAEFISRGGVRERRMYYGAINDLIAIKEGTNITRRYNKTELKESYPSHMKQLMISRPLPIFRRPDWFVSIQTLA